MSSDLESLREKIREFVGARDWEQFHDAKNLTMCLAAEVGELVAELRWISSGDVANATQDPGRRARLVAEIGDVMLSLQMLSDRLGIDLVEAAEAKLLANETKYPAVLVRGKHSLD